MYFKFNCFLCQEEAFGRILSKLYCKVSHLVCIFILSIWLSAHQPVWNQLTHCVRWHIIRTNTLIYLCVGKKDGTLWFFASAASESDAFKVTPKAVDIIITNFVDVFRCQRQRGCVLRFRPPPGVASVNVKCVSGVEGKTSRLIESENGDEN